MRSPYQILVIPFYRQENKKTLFALFKRADSAAWQGIAGGGEGKETPLKTAKREANEEAGISFKLKMILLSSATAIPVVNISGFIWGKDVLVVSEFSFGIEVFSKTLNLSREHSSYKWFTYDKAMKILEWDSNKTALWELNHRIENNKLGTSVKIYDYRAKKVVVKR